MIIVRGATLPVSITGIQLIKDLAFVSCIRFFILLLENFSENFITHILCFQSDDLAIDYQFTFNLSKKEDRQYRAINFKNSPPKPDLDVDFSIICSVEAKMNITIKTPLNSEKPLFEGNCKKLEYKHHFSKADYIFGNKNNNTLTTFYVNVYDFQPPLWIQVSFSQYEKVPNFLSFFNFF